MLLTIFVNSPTFVLSLAELALVIGSPAFPFKHIVLKITLIDNCFILGIEDSKSLSFFITHHSFKYFDLSLEYLDRSIILINFLAFFTKMDLKFFIFQLLFLFLYIFPNLASLFSLLINRIDNF